MNTETTATTTSNVHSIISHAADGLVVEIECHLANSLPNIVIVGAATKTVDEARERIRGAFGTAGLQLPRKRISINLAPADIPKDSSSLDLPIAMAILNASGLLRFAPGSNESIIGELGLNGRIRPVRGLIGKLLAGRRNGFRRFFIPSDNLAQAQIVPGLELIPVHDLRQLYDHFCGQMTLHSLPTGKGLLPTPTAAGTDDEAADRFRSIVGQSQAKRALLIAAAGGHNILFHGPPGTGKSMLARTLTALLPPLSQEEMLEVTHLHSLNGHDYEKPVTQRPFRAPHHGASHAAVVGGGSPVRPGEVSLAHRGVLLFDELPEFPRATIEALRQPLEDRVISIARARENAIYPANFIFAATANPCPCGYAGTADSSGRLCDCSQGAIGSYRSKVSGPLLDRIDISVEVSKVEHNNLLRINQPIDEITLEDDLTSSIILVSKARSVQAERFGNDYTLNSDMNNQAIKRFAYPSPEAKTVLDDAARTLHFSARSYMRCLKIARTIADMDGADTISERHLSEAIRYRGAYSPRP